MDKQVPEAPSAPEAPCHWSHDEATAWGSGWGTGWEAGYAAALTATVAVVQACRSEVQAMKTLLEQK